MRSAERIREVLQAGGRDNEPLSILEAGCGPCWDLGELNRPRHITGLDLDRAAIDRRLNEVGDLDDAVIGDVLDSGAFEEGTFDVIYSAYVLEHIAGASRAIANFGSWLRPNGILVLRLPDPRSVYGWVAKTTPFQAHVLYYRWFHGDRLAGTPGHSPYPTHYSDLLSEHGMTAAAAAAGLDLVSVHGETAFTLPTAKQSVVRAITRVLRLVSVGRLARDHENLCWVLRKA